MPGGREKMGQDGRRQGGRVGNGHFLGTERNKSARHDWARSDVTLIIGLVRVFCMLWFLQIM